jgi:choline kinase
MGSPKQLLRIGGEAILERTLKNVRASNVSEIVLVLSIMAEIVAVRREEKWSNE